MPDFAALSTPATDALSLSAKRAMTFVSEHLLWTFLAVALLICLIVILAQASLRRS